MTVTADGILVDASSSVVPIVEDDTVTVQIRGFKNMKYGRENTIVVNAAGTYDVFIQKGLYREGIMKTLHTVYLRRGQTETIQFSPDAADRNYRLDGSGWYTIVVRNSERETQYTTFFVSADSQSN